MTMQEKIARINALAKKAKTTGLTPEELEERARLRQDYLASIRQNLIAQLDNTYLVEPDGTKHRLKKQ